jgi:hypothetical protein
MKMALQVAGVTVVSEHPTISTDVSLQNVGSIDTTTANAINTGIRNSNNVLRIYDSSGVEVRTLFAAPVPA